MAAGNSKGSIVMTTMGGGVLLLVCMALLPLYLIETSQHQHGGGISVHHAVHLNQQQRTRAVAVEPRQKKHEKEPVNKPVSGPDPTPILPKATATIPVKTTKDGRTIFDLKLTDLQSDSDQSTLPLARGVAGRPDNQTPTLSTARRGHVKDCELNIDGLAYWNEGETVIKSPFDVRLNSNDDTAKFLTFTPDRGGWNNVRMSLEIMVVVAAVTGRTLVLPPKEPLYLLHHDHGNRYRGFGDFFPLHETHQRLGIDVISALEYVQHPAAPSVPDDIVKKNLELAADHCDKRAKSSNACVHMSNYLKQTGSYVNVSALHTCWIFDEEYYQTGEPPKDAAVLAWITETCGPTRDVVYWSKETADKGTLFFDAGMKQNRLLTHFYGMIHFTNATLDNYYKRMVRDALHYHDGIVCAAGKVIKAVEKEALLLMEQNGETYDPAVSDTPFSGFHIRRGDLQYKRVKIPAQEWYDNTKELWKPHELLYIATDERNKTFFNDLSKHYNIRFLDDYWDVAGLEKVDPNTLGMIETLVTSRGRLFCGTWFSTFSGYITRLRGYAGLSMMTSWYGFLPKKDAVHEWTNKNKFAYAYEWPDGWIGIDADERPDRAKDAF